MVVVMDLMIDKKIKNELKKSLKTFEKSDNPKLYNLIKKVVTDRSIYYEDPFSFAIRRRAV